MVSALSSQIYAKDGADDSSGGSSSSSSSNGSSSSSSTSSSGQESESRGRESENEARGQESEAERGGATEVRGQEFEAERGGATEIRSREAEARGSANENEAERQGLTFEIRGTIGSISNNTFTVLGRTITIDPSRVVNFRNTAEVREGRTIKIEGVIDNGAFLARDIKPLVEIEDSGSGQNSSISESEREHGIEIENESNAFEAKGRIESFSGKTLRVFGQDINVDPEKLVDFQKNVKIEEGQEVRIDGVIDDDGIFQAGEIESLVENELADDNINPDNPKKENRGLIVSIANAFGSIISSMIDLFR